MSSGLNDSLRKLYKHDSFKEIKRPPTSTSPLRDRVAKAPIQEKTTSAKAEHIARDLRISDDGNIFTNPLTIKDAGSEKKKGEAKPSISQSITSAKKTNGTLEEFREKLKQMRSVMDSLAIQNALLKKLLAGFSKDKAFLSKNNAQLFLDLSESYLEAKNYKKLINIARKALKFASLNSLQKAEMYMKLVHAYNALEDYNKAKLAAQEGLEINVPEVKGWLYCFLAEIEENSKKKRAFALEGLKLRVQDQNIKARLLLSLSQSYCEEEFPKFIEVAMKSLEHELNSSDKRHELLNEIAKLFLSLAGKEKKREKKLEIALELKKLNSQDPEIKNKVEFFIIKFFLDLPYSFIGGEGHVPLKRKIAKLIPVFLDVSKSTLKTTVSKTLNPLVKKICESESFDPLKEGVPVNELVDIGSGVLYRNAARIYLSLNKCEKAKSVAEEGLKIDNLNYIRPHLYMTKEIAIRKLNERA